MLEKEAGQHGGVMGNKKTSGVAGGGKQLFRMTSHESEKTNSTWLSYRENATCMFFPVFTPTFN